MQNFIVLGIIPGTDFQTTLSFWIGVTVILCLLVNLPHLIPIATRLHRYLTLRHLTEAIDSFRQADWSVSF